MHILESAIHPLLVHVLVGLGFLYALSRLSERVSVWIRVPVRVQARVLLVLFPVVIAAGFMARWAFRPIGARLTERVDIHIALGFLTYILWFSLAWSDARTTASATHGGKTKAETLLLVFGFLSLLVTATLGGQLVYGQHPIVTPHFFEPAGLPR